MNVYATTLLGRPPLFPLAPIHPSPSPWWLSFLPFSLYHQLYFHTSDWVLLFMRRQIGCDEMRETTFLVHFFLFFCSFLFSFASLLSKTAIALPSFISYFLSFVLSTYNR